MRFLRRICPAVGHTSLSIAKGSHIPRLVEYWEFESSAVFVLCCDESVVHDAVSEGFLSVLMMYRGAVVGSKRKLGNPPGIAGGLVGE